MRNDYRYLNLMTAIFTTCLVIANIIAVKLVDIFGLIVPAAVVIFPISYIFGDVLTEVYGYARARQVIWVGFSCNLLAVVAIWVAGSLPGASFWTGQAAYDQILGYTWRLLAASFAAYLVGEFLNSLVLAKLKVATRGRWLWLRTIGSTLIGEGARLAGVHQPGLPGHGAARPNGAADRDPMAFQVSLRGGGDPAHLRDGELPEAGRERGPLRHAHGLQPVQIQRIKAKHGRKR